MTLQELDAQIAAVDAGIEAAENTPSEGKLAIGIEDIPAIISVGILVLTGVKALLWWKPKWQTAIANVILFLQTFETSIIPTTTA